MTVPVVRRGDDRAVNPSNGAATLHPEENEWRTRCDLAAAYRLVAHFGWDDLVFTHLSARIPGRDQQYLTNEYGLLFHEVTASNLVAVDVDGQAVSPTGAPVNRAGFTIHSAIHRAVDNAHCVIHLHTLDGTAVSADPEGLRPLNQTAMLVRGDLAFHDYEGVAFDLDERPRLVSDLGARQLMLLRNHGTLAIGRSVPEAFLRMYFLERACAMQVRSLDAAAEPYLPATAIINKTASQANEGLAHVAKTYVWPALLRLVRQHYPEFES